MAGNSTVCQRSFTARIWSLKEMNYWERLKELNLMSIQRRRERYIIIHTWKIFSGAAPNDLGLVFQFNDRLGLRCLVPTLTSKSAAVNSLKDQSFTSMGPRLFNKIPREVKENDTLASFKRSLDQYLMSLPDTPTTPGYPAVNNSVLDLSVTNHGRASSELLSWDLESRTIQSIQSKVYYYCVLAIVTIVNNKS